MTGFPPHDVADRPTDGKSPYTETRETAMPEEPPSLQPSKILSVTAHPFSAADWAQCNSIMSAALPASAIWMATRGLYPRAAIELW